jgi:hypothetical protein
MVNLLTSRDKSVKDELIAEVKKENQKFGEKLISDVNEVIEHQWIRVLKSELSDQNAKLQKTMLKISSDILEIKERLSTTEDKVNAEAEQIQNIKKDLSIKKKRIDDIVTEMQDIKEIVHPEVIHEFLEKINCVTPKLDRILEINQPRTIRRRIIKAVIISVLLGALLLDIALAIHNKLFHDRPFEFIPQKPAQIEKTK